MVIIGSLGAVATPIEVKWIVKLHYVPLTCVCVSTISNPVPVGVQMAWLSCSKIGTPPAVTLVAAVIHCAVTHGPAAGGTNGQPATAYGPLCVTIGCPPTSTCGLGTRGCACPPCKHITVAPTCKRKPGMITSPPMR